MYEIHDLFLIYWFIFDLFLIYKIVYEIFFSDLSFDKTSALNIASYGHHCVQSVTFLSFTLPARTLPRRVTPQHRFQPIWTAKKAALVLARILQIISFRDLENIQ